MTYWVFAGYAVLLFLVFWLSELMRSRQERIRTVCENEAHGMKRRALIFTVGGPDVLMKWAIQKTAPAFVGFLCTDWSMETALRVIADCSLASDRRQSKLVDPRRAESIAEATRDLLRWLRMQGVKDDEIAIDVTGGLTTMSVAAFAVAEQESIDTQYVISDYDKATKKWKDGSQDAILFTNHRRA
jgi:hypothetical protein